MTGLRPKKNIHLSNKVFYSETANKKEKKIPESFAHHLKRNGYVTIGIGKLSHSVDGLVYGYEEKPSKVKEMPHSWNRFIFNPGKWGNGWNAFFGYSSGENRQSLKNKVKPYESSEVLDTGYPDGLILKSAIKELNKLKNTEKPFLLGVGFFKPHLPFNSPKKYWDLYDQDSILTASDPFIPKNVDKKSLGSMGEFHNYQLSDETPTFDKPISNKYAKKLIHGYYASISYIDNLIGKLLRELESLNLDKNTMIIIWGDHGWHLGNDLKWGKHTLFERSLKSTLLIKIPENQNKNNTINSIVETVDIYPTILEFCGIDAPYAMDGQSLIPLIKSKLHNHKGFAYSFWKNGVSLRTNRYRITKIFGNQLDQIQLFDHFIDPEENINIADKNFKIIDSLMPLIEKETPEFYLN